MSRRFPLETRTYFSYVTTNWFKVVDFFCVVVHCVISWILRVPKWGGLGGSPKHWQHVTGALCPYLRYLIYSELDEKPQSGTNNVWVIPVMSGFCTKTVSSRNFFSFPLFFWRGFQNFNGCGHNCHVRLRKKLLPQKIATNTTRVPHHTQQPGSNPLFLSNFGSISLK